MDGYYDVLSASYSSMPLAQGGHTVLDFSFWLVECQSLQSLPCDKQISLTSLHFRKEAKPLHLLPIYITEGKSIAKMIISKVTIYHKSSERQWAPY